MAAVAAAHAVAAISRAPEMTAAPMTAAVTAMERSATPTTAAAPTRGKGVVAEGGGAERRENERQDDGSGFQAHGGIVPLLMWRGKQARTREEPVPTRLSGSCWSRGRKMRFTPQDVVPSRRVAIG